MEIMINKDDLKELLKLLYKEAKQEEQNLGLRKIQLAANSVVVLTLIFLFITFIIKDFGYVFENIFTIILLFIFIIFMIGIFFLIILYLYFLNKYQRIHYITGTIIEKKLFELIIDEKNKQDNTDGIKKEILNLFPLMRVINKSKLHKRRIFENWFINTLEKQCEEDLKQFLNENF